MHHIVFIAIRIVIYATRSLAINCDKVTTIYNQSWVNVHGNLVEGFKHTKLLNLRKVY
jgi:hypothetical protein